MRVGVLFALFCLFSGGNTSVDVLKCCGDKQILNEDDECVPGTGAPLVYSQRRGKFLPRGTIPKSWSVLFGERPECEVGFRQMLIGATPGAPSFLMFDNGSLFIHEISGFVHPRQFCYDANAALACLPFRETIPVKKCCGPSASYSLEVSSCVLNTTHNLTIPPNTDLISGFPTCPETGFAIIGQLKRTEELQENGSLHFAGRVFAARTFCLETVLGEEGTNVFTCTELHMSDGGDVRFMIYPLGLILSVFFLTATLAAGCLVPSAHHLLHWQCQTSHVVSLLIGDLLLAITQLSEGSLPPGVCETFAVLMHFFFLSAFFWLNTMCFNIWWTFRDLRPASLNKSQETRRLRLYGLYAWGLPFLIAGFALIVDLLPAGSLLRPRFGEQRCWFYGDNEILPYFYIPIALLLVVNVSLFIATARELTCGLWKKEVVKSSTERAKLGRVCLKLVVVMGVTWFADVLSWALGGPSYVWYLTDLINALQGVFIFIVVGCQPQILAVVKKFCCNREEQANMSTNANHSTTQGMPSMGDSVTNNQTKSVAIETLC